MSRAKLCARCRRVVPAGKRCQCTERVRKAKIDATRPNSGERGYDADWRAVRRQYLDAHPMCSHPDCQQPATEVDHIQSINDAPELRLRWSNLRGFCKRHHSQRTARDQSFMSAEARARTWPTDLRPSAIPLTIVCGAPGSGKSYWVRQQAGSEDVVIDLDEIKARLAGTRIYSAPAATTGPALEERNGILRSLATCDAPRAWFIVSAPEPAEQQWWRRQLGGTVHVMDADEETCIARINADHRRIGHRERMVERCREWFRRARGESRAFEPPRPTAPPLPTKLLPELGISDVDKPFFG